MMKKTPAELVIQEIIDKYSRQKILKNKLKMNLNLSFL